MDRSRQRKRGVFQSSSITVSQRRHLTGTAYCSPFECVITISLAFGGGAPAPATTSLRNTSHMSLPSLALTVAESLLPSVAFFGVVLCSGTEFFLFFFFAWLSVNVSVLSSMRYELHSPATVIALFPIHLTCIHSRHVSDGHCKINSSGLWGLLSVQINFSF